MEQPVAPASPVTPTQPATKEPVVAPSNPTPTVPVVADTTTSKLDPYEQKAKISEDGGNSKNSTDGAEQLT